MNDIPTAEMQYASFFLGFLPVSVSQEFRQYPTHREWGPWAALLGERRLPAAGSAPTTGLTQELR